MILKNKNEYTKQHIVPKSYLKRFAQKGESAYRIGIIQKDNRHYIDSINNVGYIKNYYDVDFLEDKKKWEHYFDDNVEKPCDIPISHIISRVYLSNTDAIVLYEQDKLILSRYIITQLFRIPVFLDNQINNSKKIAEKKKMEILQQLYFLPIEYQDKVREIFFTDDQIKDFIFTHLDKNMEKYCDILLHKRWVLYVNKTGLPFCTSDNPVVMTNIRTYSISRSDNGIGNENTLIFFPLNPKIAIGIYPYAFMSSLEEFEGKMVILKDNDIKMVFTMNKYITTQIYKHAFIPMELYNEIFTD